MRPGRDIAGLAGKALATGLIRAYQLTFSAIAGRTCRHLPTCSDYAIEAVQRHGVWPGAWMAAARICRCGPGGTSGLDFVCEEVPPRAAWYLPWRYARWRGTNAVPPRREEASSQEPWARTSMSRSSPLSTLNSRV